MRRAPPQLSFAPKSGLAVMAFLALSLLAMPLWAADPPLVRAAKAGDLAEIRRLLDEGTAPDQHDRHNNTALIFAARDGRLDIAEALIAAGAEIDWIDGEGVTALILAAHKNHPAIAHLLLDRGAAAEQRDKWGRRALDYALRRGGDDAIARMLREAQP